MQKMQSWNSTYLSATQIFPHFYGTGRIISVVAKLSAMKPIQSHIKAVYTFTPLLYDPA